MMSMPSLTLPEIRLPEPGVVPPIVLPEVSSSTPGAMNSPDYSRLRVPLGRATVPVTSVPMKLPSTSSPPLEPLMMTPAL